MSNLNRIIVSLFLSSLVACSSINPFSSEEQKYSAGRQSQVSSPKVERNVPPPTLTQNIPWEIWPKGFDLTGSKIEQPLIVRGDEYLRQGLRELALSEYRKALATPLSDPLEEALVLRIASTELALDQPQKALSTLSDYFRRQSRRVENVDAHFSLVFAYAFGRVGDVDQSLAWFSKVNRAAAGVGGLADSSRQGVLLLLRSLSENQFAALNSSWDTDLFVANIAGQERRRRSTRPYASLIEIERSPRFWELDQTEAVQVNPPHFEGPVRVGVILPLSGKFGNLGLQLQQGIELAMGGQESDQYSQVIFKDDQGDPVAAAAAAQELIATNQVSVILGPLLAEGALEVSKIARQNGIAQVAFSKQTGFPTGDSIFRLGPTVVSQIDSLVEVVSRRQKITNFGLVYPQGSGAEEYVSEFRSALHARGLELGYEVSYVQADAPTFVQIGEELKNSNVQAVFLVDGLRVAASFMGSLPPELKGNLMLLGTASWDDPLQLEQNRSALEGVTFVSPFFGASRRPIVGQFVETFAAKYGKKPNFLAAQGFDAATMLFAAIRKQNQDGTPFTSAFRGISVYDGLTGVTSVDTSGEMNRQFSVVQLKREGLVDLMEEPEVEATAPSFVYRGNMPVSEQNLH